MNILAIGVDIAAGDVVITFSDGVIAQYPVKLLLEMLPKAEPIPELDPEPED